MSTASLSEDDFQQIQQIFMEKHYREFDDSDENKLSYMPIFNEYVSVGRFHSHSHTEMFSFYKYVDLKQNLGCYLG